MFYFPPDVFVTDKDEEEEEASQHVAGVNHSEQDRKTCVVLTECSVIVVDDEMHALNCPQDTEDHKKFQIKELKNKHLMIINGFSALLWA